MGAAQQAGASMLWLLPTWVFCTCIASLAGNQYVQSTLDCLTPVTLAQAAAVLLYLFHRCQRKQQCRQQLQTPATVTLGALQLLSSILTLGSFGLAGVAETYMVRAIEPLCSCALLCFLYQRRCSSRELLLLTVVVVGVWCVVWPRAPNNSGVHIDVQQPGAHRSDPTGTSDHGWQAINSYACDLWQSIVSNSKHQRGFRACQISASDT